MCIQAVLCVGADNWQRCPTTDVSGYLVRCFVAVVVSSALIERSKSFLLSLQTLLSAYQQVVRPADDKRLPTTINNTSEGMHFCICSPSAHTIMRKSSIQKLFMNQYECTVDQELADAAAYAPHSLGQTLRVNSPDGITSG